MKIKVLLVILALTACDASTDGWRIKKALESCLPNEGLGHLTIFQNDYVEATCVNGVRYLIKENTVTYDKM